MWTIPAEGGTPRRITKATGDQTAPTWSRDGQWIYFSEPREGGRDIWRVPATGGPAEQLTRTGTGFLAYESADGASLLYQPKNGDSPLLIAPIRGGGAPRQLVGCVRTAAFALAGSAVFYAACEPGSNPSLHALDMVSGTDRLLGTLEHFPPDPHLSTSLCHQTERRPFHGLVRRGGDLMLIENFR